MVLLAAGMIGLLAYAGGSEGSDLLLKLNHTVVGRGTQCGARPGWPWSRHCCWPRFGEFPPPEFVPPCEYREFFPITT